MTCEAGRPGPRWLESLAPFGAVRKLASCVLILPLTLAGCLNDPFLATQQEEEATPPPEVPSVTPVEPAPPTPDSVAAPEISMVPTQVLQPAPELFSSEEWALWDGQRTMSGRWVALPDVAFSTRVRITNAENGASTDGALILRNPDLAGPRLIVSSDTAQALGLRPNVTATVVMVALAYGPPPDSPASDPADAVNPDGTPPERLPVVRPTLQTAAPGTSQGTPQGTPQAPAQTAAIEATPSVGAAPQAPPESAPATPQASPPASPPATPPTTPPANSPAPPSPAPAIEPSTAPPTEAPDPAPTASGAGASGAPAPASDRAIADGLAYIQAGIFGDPGNATRLIGRLQDAGLPAHGVNMPRAARTLTRVLVGPFDTIEARDRALETVRQIGPEDAVPVRG